MQKIVLLIILASSILFFGCTSTTNQTSNTTIANITASNNSSIIVNAQTNTAQMNTDLQRGTAVYTQTGEVPLYFKNYNFSPTVDQNGKLIVYYFYSSLCTACEAIQPQIENLSMEYNATTDWKFYDIRTDDGLRGYRAYVYWRGYNNSQMLIPEVLVDNNTITNRIDIASDLGPIIANFTINSSS